MISNAEMIADDNGIEVLVGYKYERSESTLDEVDNQYHVGCLCLTELESVEVIIKGRGIDILPLMSERQKEHIIAKLNYD